MASTYNEDNGWGRFRENAPHLLTPVLLPTEYLKHMIQVLLELTRTPEPLSSSTYLHTLIRKFLDLEVRSSILANTLHRHRASGGGHHVQPSTGTDLQGADGAYLT